jgi:hypothetical protein
MNSSPDFSDPLLRSLADEVSDLPVRAAQEARRRSAQRIERRRQATIALALLVAFGLAAKAFWPASPSPRVAAPSPIAIVSAPSISSVPAPAVTPPAPSEYVKVQTEEEAIENPPPVPAGLSKEQQEVVEAARGLPLLLVKDASGKVTRIHVIER